MTRLLTTAILASAFASFTTAQADDLLARDPETGEYLYQDADDAEPERPSWSGSVNAAASLSEGNTNRRTAAAGADAERRGENDRLTLGFAWNYAEEKDDTNTKEITQRRTRGNAKYDYFVTERGYVYTNASAENDRFSDLDLRLIVGAGGGYQFAEDEDFKLSAEAGVAYYDEKRDTSADEEYVAARLAYSVEYKPRETVTLSQDVEAIPSLENSDDIYVRKDSRVRLTLTEKMFTQFQWVLDYDNTPAANTDRIDNLFLIGVGWEF